ncbi:MAG: rhomboid family intramembrane serine protease [Luteibaculum sp.]
MKLLYINVAVFALIAVFSILGFLFQLDLYTTGSGVKQLFITEYLSANSDPILLLKRPWTIITYMFTHEGLWHILVNMLIFYYIGNIFSDLLGNQRVLPLYIFGGVAGLLLYVLSFNLIPAFGSARLPIIGASASVLAIMVATATYVPNYPIRLMLLGTVALKYIAAFYVVIDLLALRGTSGNLGGHIAHLGGAIFGFIYARQLTKGNDLGKYFYLIVNSFKGLFQSKPKVKVVHKEKSKTSKNTTGKKSSSDDYQKRVDEILDKISKSGYQKLTQEEKDFLFNASKR